MRSAWDRRSRLLAAHAAFVLLGGPCLADGDNTQTTRLMTPREVAQLSVDAGESEEALRYLIRPSLPGHQAMDAPAALLEVARMEHLRRKDTAALARCRDVLKLDAGPELKLATRLLLADLCISVDRLDEAETMLTELRDTTPVDGEMAALTWRFCVDALLHNRVETAERWLRWLAASSTGPAQTKATELSQRIAAGKAAKAPFWSADFLLTLGASLEAGAEPVLADRTYAAISRQWPQWKPDYVLARQAWNLLNFHNDEALARAMKLLERLVSEYPKSAQVPPALFRLHFLYWNEDRAFGKAKGCLRRIINDYPASKEYRDALFQLASVEKSDQPGIAIALFERLIREYPEDSSVAQVNLDRLLGRRRD